MRTALNMRTALTTVGRRFTAALRTVAAAFDRPVEVMGEKAARAVLLGAWGLALLTSTACWACLACHRPWLVVFAAFYAWEWRNLVRNARGPALTR